MKDSIDPAESGKFFFYRTFMLPELNRTQTLILSWIMARVVAAKFRRTMELERKKLDAKFNLDKIEKKEKETPAPIDEWWVTATDSKINQTFPYISKRLAEKTILQLKKRKILECDSTAIRNKNGQYIRARLVRINVYHLNKRVNDWPKSSSLELTSYISEKVSKYEKFSVKIYTNLQSHFHSVNEMLFYHWLRNWLAVHGPDCYVSREIVQQSIGLQKDGQQSCILSLSGRGMVKSEIVHKVGKMGFRTDRALVAIPPDQWPAITNGKQAKNEGTAPLNPAIRNALNPAIRNPLNPAIPKRVTKRVLKTLASRPSAGEGESVDLFGNKAEGFTHQEYLPFVLSLREAVTKSRAMTVPYSKKNWCKEFATLAKQLQSPTAKDIIAQVLDWYVKNKDKSYVPVCDSAKTFRTKFDRIRAAMKRMVDTSIEITPEATEIAKTLSRLGWPGETKKKLAPVVQASLSNYVRFRNILKKSFGESKSAFDIKLEAHFPAAKAAVMKWFYDVHQRRSRQTTWNGDFTPHDVWKWDHPDVQHFGKSLSVSFAGTPKRWDVLYAKLAESLGEKS